MTTSNQSLTINIRPENYMSQKKSQSESVNYKTDYSDDEIEIIDVIRVILKWKYLIIGGTAVCAIAAIIISLMLPKIYRIETLIQPGILSLSDDGKSIYIDTPENIKSLIETGVFELRILNNLAKSDGVNIPEALQFKVTLPDGYNTLKITYETPQIEQGIQILDFLGKFLIEEYSNFIEFFKSNIDSDLNITKAEIQKFSSIKHSSEVNINTIEKRIHELEAGIVVVNENTNHLNKERNKLLLKEKNESNILSAILYSNTIQQNLQLANEYEDEIKNLKLIKENELQKISGLENNIQRELAKIKGFENKKSNIKNVQIIRKPYSTKYPVKPRKRFNVILATVTGVLLMVILSFFFEYISKYKKSSLR